MKKIKISYVIIIIGICLILIASLMMFFGKISNKQNKNESKEEPIENEVQIDLSEINKDIISQIPSIEFKELKKSKFVYKSEFQDIDKIDRDMLIVNSINNIEPDLFEECTDIEDEENYEECNFKIKKDLVIDKLKTFYGNTKLELLEEVIVNDYITCKLTSTYYLCSNHKPIDNNTNNYTSFFLFDKDYLNVNDIVKATKNDKGNLYIYEKYINIRLENKSNFKYDDIDTYNFGLYSDSDSNNKITNDLIIGKKYYVNNETMSFNKQIMDKYNDVAPTYKHTFAIGEDNNYHWVSTEKYIDK